MSRNGYRDIVEEPFLATVDSTWQAGTPALQFPV
jgi:hypothetical protein